MHVDRSMETYKFALDGKTRSNRSIRTFAGGLRIFIGDAIRTSLIDSSPSKRSIGGKKTV